MTSSLTGSSRPGTAANAHLVLFLLAAFSLVALPSNASAFSPDTKPHVSSSTKVPPRVDNAVSATTSAATETSSSSSSTAPAEVKEVESKSAEISPDLASLLDDALKFNAKNFSTTIVNNLMTLRQSSNPMAAESYLDDILSIVDGNSKQTAIFPRFSTRYSRRARLKSMAKVLELSTPAAEEGDADAEDEEVSAGRRRRRALTVLLRTLAKESESNDSFSSSRSKGTTIIRKIERAAIQDAKQNTLLEDMSNRLPPGLETPKYDVIVRRKGGYEIRKYEPFSVCTVAMKSSLKANDDSRSKTDAKVSMPQLSGASSFGALAGYLFGKNSQETAMKMTTPVLTTNAGMDVESSDDTGTVSDTPGTKEMSFVLPSTFWTEDGTERAPQPLDGSGVRLQRDAGGTRATLMFGGFASKAEVEERKKQLLSSIEDDEEYMLESEGAIATLAQYNDPFTPPWKRLNEVSVPVMLRERQ